MNYCFATMAVGDEYIELAKKLLVDIFHYFPEATIYVLTDNKDNFSEFPVTIVPFKRQGYWYMYHEKQQAIRAAAEKFDACLFLDADCRLVARPPMEEYCQLPVGIYGAYNQTFRFKFDAEIKRYTGKERWLKNTPKRRAHLLQQYCDYFKVDFWSCNFLQEACLLYVGSNHAKSLLKIWDYMGRDLSAKHFEWGEGFIYGIAAEYLGIASDAIPKIESWLFKDILTTKEMAQKVVYQQCIAERKSISSQYKRSIAKKMSRNISGLIRYILLAPAWLIYYRQQAKRAALKN